MKKLIYILIFLLILFCLTGCGIHTNEDNPTIDIHENAAYDGKLDNTTKAISDDDSFIFTWLTYAELCVTQNLRERSDYERYIDSLFKNMKKAGVTHCLVQVRPFADAMYDSELFPESLYIRGARDFDPFECVTALSQKYEINIHAWINPYRIASGELTKESIYYKEYEDDIMETSSGVYFNPASMRAQGLIISAVEELMTKYEIKGIHIDDYFYPEDMADEDSQQYEEYKAQGGRLSLADWRRENVSSLLSGIYLKVRSFGEEKLFTVSPCGDIDKSYNKLYADVYLWARGGYCDMLLPQIYFGFENESQPFEKCLESWLSITDTDRVMLVPGLALYKCGRQDDFAGRGKNEWQESSDIISRQVKMIFQDGCNGFALYSGSYINFSEKFTKNELNNLVSML